MNVHSVKRASRLAALGAAATLPLAVVACAGSNPPPSAAPPASTIAVGPAPAPGYATGAPPGYPAATAPPGYPGQPAYPAAQPAYPQAAPTAAYPPPAAPPAQTAYAPPPVAPAPGATATAAPGPLGPTDPNTLQGILAGIQGALQGTVVPGGAMSGDVTDAGLKLYALHVAPGMQPEGDELKQTLTEGQHSVLMLTLQAGKCYAIVGFSPPGAIKDLDLNLLAPPFYMTLAGQDLTHNNTPVIGASPSPMCPVTPFPLQYKLDVFAKSGSGQVAVQLYSKTKS